MGCYDAEAQRRQVKAPFTIVPFWNSRGEAQQGVMNGGVLSMCNPANERKQCVGIQWPWDVSAADRQRNLSRGSWHGTMLESKRDKSGLGYMRNRYYDPQTGRFTQEDPIGLAGGMNLYGFAAGDPINFSDPFGLSPMDTYVNCRPVGGEGKDASVAHCAVRVVDEKRGIDQTIELGPDSQNNKEIYWSLGNSERTGDYDANAWVRVAVPKGMASEQFDNAVLGLALRETMAQRGQTYYPTGNTNSNRFVFNVITGAGGRVPRAAAAGFIYGAPGLCGGVVRTGSRCSP